MCGIESFEAKKGQSSKNYKSFVRKYLSQYNTEDVYNHIRCRLAHNYTVGGQVALPHKNPHLHLSHLPTGEKVINLENFLTDFETGAAQYFADLATGSDLQANFLKRLGLGFAVASRRPAKA